MEVRLSKARKRVYSLLVEGLAPCKVAEHLGVKRSTVSHHKKELEREGYIRPVPGTSNPQLYTRGPRSNILDKAISNIEVRSDGGTVRDPPASNSSPKAPDTTFVPDSRVHINGRVVFEVSKIGDMHRLLVPNGTGERREVPLFPQKPYRDHHNTRSWKTKISINGELVSIEFWEGTNTRQLHIWPPELNLVPEQFENAETYMIHQA
ncbi:MAG TPA: winged helix-turn-helix domain-containing protein, partial [Methanomassiliicoccales archaeon]|nr:winged helix-turn-helix domain-containing protein [Methanomassiliicoccales archaeon]